MQRSFDGFSFTSLLRHTDSKLGSLRAPQTLGLGSMGWLTRNGSQESCDNNNVLVTSGSEEFIAETVKLTDSLDGVSEFSPPDFAPVQKENVTVALGDWMGQLENSLERRLDAGIQSVLGICDRRFRARDDDLRTVTEGLQLKTEGATERISLRVDSLTHELERIANPITLRSQQTEFREVLSRVQSDVWSHDTRLQQCVTGDDVSERNRHLERSLQQRLDERFAQMERRVGDLQIRFDARVQDMSKQCQLLGQRTEQQQNHQPLTDTLMRRLGECKPIKELREEVQNHTSAIESQQRRLLTIEQKIPLMDAKVEVTDELVRNQLQGPNNSELGLCEMLEQVTASVAATSQRVEAATVQRCEAMEARFGAEVGLLRMSLGTQFLTKIEECRTVQKRLVQYVEERIPGRSNDENVAPMLSRGRGFELPQNNVSGALLPSDSVLTEKIAALEDQAGGVRSQLGSVTHDVETRVDDQCLHVCADTSAAKGDNGLVSSNRVQPLDKQMNSMSACPSLCSEMSNISGTPGILNSQPVSGQECQIEMTIREVQDRFGALSARIDELEEENSEGMHGLKVDITNLEKSLTALDAEVTRRLQDFSEDMGILQNQNRSLEVSTGNTKVNLQRLHVNVDSVQATLLTHNGTLVTHDGRIDEVCKSLALAVNSFRKLEERHAKFEEQQLSVEDLLNEVENLRSRVESLPTR